MTGLTLSKVYFKNIGQIKYEGPWLSGAQRLVKDYPNLMTYEAVRGAEWYNNGPEFTTTAPELNTILPFTRKVVGPMDIHPLLLATRSFLI